MLDDLSDPRGLSTNGHDDTSWIPTLRALCSETKRAVAFDEVERIEGSIKDVLHAIASREAGGRAGRDVARIQRDTGFLLKYKSYAMKCASPLGYAVFFQQPGEGFSFQRHVTHKTEVFHILDVHPGGYVFICDYASWQAIYDVARFTEWLSGKPDDSYDQFCYTPVPGDVIIIDELNVVHTVVGCVLEEFATVSTDMVDRLHDQNSGKPIPEKFDRTYALECLANVEYPRHSRVVDARDPARPRTILTDAVSGGVTARVIADTFVKATHYRIDQGCQTPVLCDERAASVYVVDGSGWLLIGDREELGGGYIEPTPVHKGDLITILPSVAYRAVGMSERSLALVEHRIALDVALARGAGR